MSTLTISPDERARIIREAKEELVSHLIASAAPDVWLTPSQAGGILNVSQPTLVRMRIPRYEMDGAIQYKLSEVQAYRESKKI